MSVGSGVVELKNRLGGTPEHVFFWTVEALRFLNEEDEIFYWLSNPQQALSKRLY